MEYGLIAGLIALGIIGSLVGTRGSLSAVFGSVSTGLGSSSPSAATPSVVSPAEALNFAAKGGYVSKKSYTGCSIGNCSWSNEVDYRYADGSLIIVRPANANTTGVFGFQYLPNASPNYYYMNSRTGNGDAGDTLYVQGVTNGQSYNELITFRSDGTATGQRTDYVNNQSVQSATAYGKGAFQSVFDAAAYAKTLN